MPPRSVNYFLVKNLKFQEQSKMTKKLDNLDNTGPKLIKIRSKLDGIWAKIDQNWTNTGPKRNRNCTQKGPKLPSTQKYGVKIQIFQEDIMLFRFLKFGRENLNFSTFSRLRDDY